MTSKMWPDWYRPFAKLPAEALITAVAARFGIPRNEVVGRTRAQACMGPRVVVARILRDRGHSYPVIGRLLGNRDHTTIMSCLDRFDVYSRIDPRVPDIYRQMRDRA